MGLTQIITQPLGTRETLPRGTVFGEPRWQTLGLDAPIKNEIVQAALLESSEEIET
jgi:hypothetical protein